jgi:hypothetical protein
MRPLPWVKSMVEDVLDAELPAERISETRWQHGDVYLHPEDGLVEIVGGSFWGNHGVSNFWYWRVLATDEVKHGYGFDARLPEKES